MSENLQVFEISDLYSNLVGTLDEEKFFKSLCKEIKSQLKCDRISASIFHAKEESTLVYASKKQSDLLMRKPLKSVEAQIIRTQKSYFSNSAARDPMFSTNSDSQIISELCVPLVIADSVMGCINLQNINDGKLFSKVEIEKIYSLLDELRVPLQNLKIYLSAKNLNEALLKKIEEKEAPAEADNGKIISDVFRISNPEFIGTSSEMRDLLGFTEKVAKQEVNVLVSGESGTGKDMIARRIHCLGKRSSNGFGVVDCSSSDQDYIQTSLFGNGGDKSGLIDEIEEGTILIKKVENLSIITQSKLIGFIKSKKGRRIRFISTCVSSLEEKVDSGEFREDLFYCLNTIEIKVPSLRERKGDIELLVNHYLNQGKDISNQKSFSPGAMRCLSEYSWPGNILELQSVVERSYILADSVIVEKAHLSDHLQQETREEQVEESSVYEFTEMPLGELERFHICRTLEHLEGNKTKTAKVLGITVKTLYNKLHSYGMIAEKEV